MRPTPLGRLQISYFDNLLDWVQELCTDLSSGVENSSVKDYSRLNESVAELLDYFYYFQVHTDLQCLRHRPPPCALSTLPWTPTEP